jgi:hypothetical protein
MVIFAAAGDNDSSDGGPAPANVDLPASAPHIIGCGGTMKPRGEDEVETVWNNSPGSPDGHGTGGGFSRFFPKIPQWQIGDPHGPGRVVPDVAANADPNTGYQIFVSGQPVIVGGTSAVPPLYAGLFAAFGEKLGFVTPDLYLNQTCFNDIREGDNGAQRARIGPDACTGLGSPIGTRLAKLMSSSTRPAARAFRELYDQLLRERGDRATRIADLDGGLIINSGGGDDGIPIRASASWGFPINSGDDGGGIPINGSDGGGGIPIRASASGGTPIHEGGGGIPIHNGGGGIVIHTAGGGVTIRAGASGDANHGRG